jgi:hypothetical protein
MNKALLMALLALMASGIILNAKTLEIREYTIIGNDPFPAQVLDAARALPFPKKGMVFNASLSLPVPRDGKIVFRDLKPVSYPSKYDDKGKILKESSRQIGISVMGNVSKEKRSGSISLRIAYDHSTPTGNRVTALPSGELLYQPVFSTFSMETTIELIPDQWVITGGLKKTNGETKIMAFNFVE